MRRILVDAARRKQAIRRIRWQPRSTQTRCIGSGSEIWDAGAIPAASTFSELASTSDTSRLVTSQDAIGKEVATHDDAGESRQQAASSVMPRPMTATKKHYFWLGSRSRSAPKDAYAVRYFVDHTDARSVAGRGTDDCAE